MEFEYGQEQDPDDNPHAELQCNIPEPPKQKRTRVDSTVAGNESIEMDTQDSYDNTPQQRRDTTRVLHARRQHTEPLSLTSQSKCSSTTSFRLCSINQPQRAAPCVLITTDPEAWERKLHTFLRRDVIVIGADTKTGHVSLETKRTSSKTQA